MHRPFDPAAHSGETRVQVQPRKISQMLRFANAGAVGLERAESGRARVRERTHADENVYRRLFTRTTKNAGKQPTWTSTWCPHLSTRLP